VEFNFRHDWNSLITEIGDEQAGKRFSTYSRELFPQREKLVEYLNDYAKKSHLKVVYNTDVSNITRVSSSDDKERFTMIDQRQQVYNCQ